MVIKMYICIYSTVIVDLYWIENMLLQWYEFVWWLERREKILVCTGEKIYPHIVFFLVIVFWHTSIIIRWWRGVFMSNINRQYLDILYIILSINENLLKGDCFIFFWEFFDLNQMKYQGFLWKKTKF